MVITNVINVGFGEIFDYPTPSVLTNLTYVAGGGKNAMYILPLTN